MSRFKKTALLLLLRRLEAGFEVKAVDISQEAIKRLKDGHAKKKDKPPNVVETTPICPAYLERFDPKQSFTKNQPSLSIISRSLKIPEPKDPYGENRERIDRTLMYPPT